ncbi:type II toxin-antitoxin system RelE/ParE family toxin [Glacieibacterium sp.]|uniref:type II toxin-antitoxin system RelE/ParE family toxin n=1 Tax=Glacieibacterium sp. TaxID=2860237 RepID=UPI003B00F111
MNRYTLSPLARDDLIDIWQFTVGRWSIAQADAYVSDIRDVFSGAAARPNSGSDCTHLRPGMRKLGSGSHVVFYRVIDGGIDIVRVLHVKMDYARHL